MGRLAEANHIMYSFSFHSHTEGEKKEKYILCDNLLFHQALNIQGPDGSHSV